MSKNPRDAIVQKLIRKVESLREPKNSFRKLRNLKRYCTRGRPHHKLCNDIVSITFEENFRGKVYHWRSAFDQDFDGRDHRDSRLSH